MIIFTMAWRNIWRNRIRSMIIMCSVVLGLFAGLFVLSIYKGMLDDRVRMVIDTEVSHLQIHHPNFKDDYDPRFAVEDPESVQRKLQTVASINSIAIRTVSQGMLATGSGSTGLQIIGIDPDNENKVSRLNSKIVEGSAFSQEKKNQLIIGRKLADKMHLRIGNKVVLTFTDPESNIVSGAFRVVGIYKTDNAPRDERIAYTQRKDISKLLSIGNAFHEVAIILNRDDQVAAAKAVIKNLFKHEWVETWSEISPETKLMIDTTDSYSDIFIAIIMFALSFGIINTMLMAVLERTREIGMLLAIGMNRIKIFGMILTETSLLTITSTPLGIMLTWITVQAYGRKGINISSIAGTAMAEFGFSPMIYPSFPWERMPTELIIVAGAAILSSLIPAVKAIRLNPANALQK